MDYVVDVGYRFDFVVCPALGAVRNCAVESGLELLEDWGVFDEEVDDIC